MTLKAGAVNKPLLGVGRLIEAGYEVYLTKHPNIVNVKTMNLYEWLAKDDEPCMSEQSCSASCSQCCSYHSCGGSCKLGEKVFEPMFERAKERQNERPTHRKNKTKRSRPSADKPPRTARLGQQANPTRPDKQMFLEPSRTADQEAKSHHRYFD